MFCYRSHPKVKRWQGWAPDSLSDAEDFIARLLPFDPNTPGWSQLAIRHEARLIGDIGVHVLNGQSAELGITLAPEWQSRGLASEALRAVTQCLLRTFERLEATTDADNLPCQRLLQAVGFRQSGELWELSRSGAGPARSPAPP